jgi:sensor histidine kinase YesM
MNPYLRVVASVSFIILPLGLTGIYDWLFRLWGRYYVSNIWKVILVVVFFTYIFFEIDFYYRFHGFSFDIRIFIINLFKLNDNLNVGFEWFGQLSIEQQEQVSFGSQFIKVLAYMMWLITYHAVHYILQLNEARIARLQAEAKLREAELVNLRGQMNPHFLFNAMNSIHALTLTNNEAAGEAVLKLSDLLRYSLNYGQKNLVPLHEELEMVEKYLSLEKIRFGKRLRFNLTIDNDLLREKVPPILFQTLVENAVKHGISQHTGGGDIEIWIRREQDFLCLEIQNTGQIADELQANSGIGIANTRQRLEMIYGNRAQFSLQNLDHQKVQTKICLPMES